MCIYICVYTYIFQFIYVYIHLYICIRTYTFCVTCGLTPKYIIK